MHAGRYHVRARTGCRFCGWSWRRCSGVGSSFWGIPEGYNFGGFGVEVGFGVDRGYVNHIS